MFKPHIRGIRPMLTPEDYALSQVFSFDIVTEDNVRINIWKKNAADEGRPYFLVFHGNTGHFGDVGKPKQGDDFDPQYRIKLLKKISEYGCGFIAVSLRGYGISDKVKSSEEGFVKDTRAVVEYILNRENIDNKRIVVFGESLGASVAMIAAEQMTIMAMPPAMVATVAAFSSMKWKVVELHPELNPEAVEKKLRHKFDSEERLKRLSKETLFFISHPGSDEVTRKDHSEKLASIAKESGFGFTYKQISGGHITWDAGEVISGIMEVYEKNRN